MGGYRPPRSEAPSGASMRSRALTCKHVALVVHASRLESPSFNHLGCSSSFQSHNHSSTAGTHFPDPENSWTAAAVGSAEAVISNHCD